MTVDICLSKSSISLKCYRLSKVHIRSTDVCVKCWFDIYYKYYWNRIFAGSALWNVFLSHIDGERKSDSKKPFQFLKYISSGLQSSTLRLFFAIWHCLFLFLKANSSEEEMNVLEHSQHKDYIFNPTSVQFNTRNIYITLKFFKTGIGA